MTTTLASLTNRVPAVIIDAALIAVPIGVGAGVGTMLALDGNTAGVIIVGVSGVLALVWTVAFVIMQGGGGSVGQRVMRVRLVDEATGQPIGFGRALLRNIVFGAAGAIIVGYVSVLFDSSGRRQGWHDRATRTIVADTRAAGRNTPRVDTANAYPFAGDASPFAQGAPHTPQIGAGESMPAPLGQPAFGRQPTFAADPPQPAFAAQAVQAMQAKPPVPPPPPPPPQAPPQTSPPQAPVYEPVARHAGPVGAPPGIIAHVPGITGDQPARDAARHAPEAVHAPQAVSSAPALVTLVWDDGTAHTVTGTALFGRDPLRERGAVPIRVDDATLSLSKTHFLITGAPAGPVIVDRASTNGVVIARGGVRTTVRPGEQTPLLLGDLIECGDRWARVEASR